MRHQSDQTSYLVGKREFERWSFIKASAEVFTCSYDTEWSRCLEINSIYHLRMTHHIAHRRSSVHEECMCKSMKGNTFNWLEKVLYIITWLLCVFSLVVDHDLLKDTHAQMTSNACQRTCFSFFMPQKSFNKPFEFLLYKTNRLQFPNYCNRPQKTSQRVKNNGHSTSSYVVLFVLYKLWEFVIAEVHYFSGVVPTHIQCSSCMLCIWFTYAGCVPQ